MAGDSRRRIVWNVALMIDVVFMFTVEETVAQVVIEERVEISDETVEKVSTPVGIIEVPFDGSLHVAYYLAHSHPNAIPSNDTLFVTADGSLLASEEYVQTRFDSPTTQFYTCNSQNGTRYTYQTLSLDPWMAGHVEQGDLITLSTNLMQAPVYDKQTDSTWTVIVQSADQCNDLYLLVSVERDTLDIHFTPPKDGNVYPEPGLIIDVKASVRGAGNNGEVVFEIENHDYPDTEYPDTLIYFLDGTDTTLTLDPVPVVNDTASAQLVVTQYWGAVDVTAKYVVDVASKNLATTVILHEKSERWPEDKDRDGIPDEWERDNGTLSMIDPSATCDKPSPVCTEQDLIWDEETSSIIVNDYDGDNITKILEYRGVKIGERLKRLSPQRKEIFIAFDTSFDSDDITWVASELTSQLDIDVQRIGGYYTGFGDRVLGNPDSIMTWLGPISPSRNVVLMPKKDVPFPGGTTSIQRLLNGIYVQFGIYTVSNLYAGSSACNNELADCRAPEFKNQQRKLVFGSTSRPLETGVGVEARVYDGVISNFYGTNSIPENVKHRFKWITIGTGGLAVPWYALFNDQDLNGNGGPPFQDEVNPFDIMSPSKVFNDMPPDGDVAGRSEDQQLRTTMLHELGHALGLKHPTSSTTTSVMRKGIGPGKSMDFSSKDKRSFRFKSPTTN